MRSGENSEKGSDPIKYYAGVKKPRGCRVRRPRSKEFTSFWRTASIAPAWIFCQTVGRRYSHGDHHVRYPKIR